MAINNFIGGAALDLPQILAVVTMITFIVVIGNLIVDTLYAFLDPRVDASFRDPADDEGGRRRRDLGRVGGASTRSRKAAAFG